MRSVLNVLGINGEGSGKTNREKVLAWLCVCLHYANHSTRVSLLVNHIHASKRSDKMLVDAVITFESSKSFPNKALDSWIYHSNWNC